MSDYQNDQLYELARDHLEYWEGEGIGAVIQADLDRDDLESLHEHLKESARLMFEAEFNPNEVYGSEQRYEAADTLRDQLRDEGAPF